MTYFRDSDYCFLTPEELEEQIAAKALFNIKRPEDLSLRLQALDIIKDLRERNKPEMKIPLAF